MLKPYQRAEVSFELRKEIGQEGKNARVHIAYDPNLDCELVVKTIPKTGLDKDSYFAESQLLNKSSHPHVAPIYYACEDADFIYLAMPYFPQGSLNAVLAKRFLTIREVIRYSTQFLSGLHNVHSKGLIHFDVKPDNILLTERNDAVVADFGLARRTNYDGLAEQDRSYLKMQPPEYFQKSEFSLRFDIYQVGLTLYRMVNGNQRFYEQFNAYGNQAAFDHDQFEFDVINERFPDRSAYPEHVPARVRSVIATCLKSDPALRYRSSTDVVSALASVNGADLDWCFERAADGSRRWTKIQTDREIRLHVDSTMRGHAEKRSSNGPFRRITPFCKEGISSAEIRRFLRTDGE
jgi:eukaryotic-like serine/threonine-protein kinase